MPDKDPMNYSLLTYIWVFALSLFGGVAHNVRKIKDGIIEKFSFSELIGDLVLSGFIGVMTFYLCEYADFNKLLTALMIGMSSHMGTKGIMIMEEFFTKKIGNIK